MKEIILLKSGEIALKGLNRHVFEDRLIKNCRRRLRPLGNFKFSKAQSALYIYPQDDNIDLDETVDRLKKVFGFAALARACELPKDFEVIKTAAAGYLREELLSSKTFKVAAKRSDKSFAYNSPKICEELGAHLLAEFPHLKVDVKNPDFTVVAEIRESAAYVHGPQMPGAGGMPIGTSGRAALMISGGIDSPVAGYLMAKRGLEVEAVHFAAPPYTSERAKLKVIALCEKMCEYTGSMKLTVINFTEIQEEIKKHCPEDLFTVIMRRYMVRITEEIARKNGSGALITGESLAQVASQTLPAIACTDMVAGMPVFRPLIGWDKSDIIAVSQKIDTFETSILPYEDCCTVFTPRHPKTNPDPAQLEAAERVLDSEALIARAAESAEVIKVRPKDDKFSVCRAE